MAVSPQQDGGQSRSCAVPLAALRLACDAEPVCTAAAPPADGSGGPEERPFTCSVCGAGYRSSLSLKQHRHLHLGHTVCPVCGRTLSVVARLRDHLRHVHGWDPALVRQVVPTAPRRPSRSLRVPEGALHLSGVNNQAADLVDEVQTQPVRGCGGVE